MSSPLLFDLPQLEQVKEWLVTLRKHYSQHSDIWDLCRHWETLKLTLLDELNSGHYEFDPLQRIEIDDGLNPIKVRKAPRLFTQTVESVDSAEFFYPQVIESLNS